MNQYKMGLLFFLCLFLIHSCHSQTALTKEYDENEYICSYFQFEGVDLYATFDTDNNEIKIYDSNHTLLSSLIHDPENYYNLVQIYGLSRDVFNSDSNIEFLINKIGVDGITSKMILLNDQNIVLQEYESSTGIRTIGNRNYLVESINRTDIDQGQARMKKTDKLYAMPGRFRKIIF